MKLKSGREIHASRGILGLSETEPDELFDGYDGVVWREGEEKYNEHSVPFTAEERREIADRMIACWQRWAARGMESNES
jgi:hypothetical protein